MHRILTTSGSVVYETNKYFLSTPTLGLIPATNRETLKSGYLTLQGEIAIPFEYNDTTNFDLVSGCALVGIGPKGNQKHMLITVDGRPVCDTQYDHIGYPRNGRILYSDGGPYGYLTHFGEPVIHSAYENATDFSHGLAAVRCRDSSMYRFIDIHGRDRLGPYRGYFGDSITFSDCGLAYVPGDLQESPPRYIDLNGNTAFFIEGKSGSLFSEGLANFQDKSGLEGYVSSTGEVVIPPKYDSGLSFMGGYAYVHLGDERYYISKSDVRVPVPAGYSALFSLKPAYGRLIVGDSNRLYGLADLSGNFVVDPIYRHVDEIADGLLAVGFSQK